MATITRKGRVFGDWLIHRIGLTNEILETASLITRHATTYTVIQEGWCSSEYQNNNDAAREYYEAKEETLEKRIRDLVYDLPHTDAGPFTVEFGGDPRGSTVKIIDPTSGAAYAADNPLTY